ncbi:hypothetical protein [Flavobacterium sp. ZB4P13]|uniref:hypothetical protein n=1 Tax=Flavobacterium sp. ZB4P13 TaxID=3401728 RepID=UPI003AAF26E6
MNKEKTVLDFAIYALMDVEELCDYITYFFGEKDKLDPFSDKNFLEYEEFIKGGIDINQIIITSNCNPELKSISDLLNNEEINNLLNYLNENFTEGYPDGDGFGAPTSLEFKTTDLHRLFYEYFELRKHNQNVFITYYIQMFDIVVHECMKLIITEKLKIINIEKAKDLLNLDLSSEYLDFKKKEYKTKLFKSVENNNFQLKGFSDSKGLHINYDKSLTDYLEFLNKQDCSKIVYSVYFEKLENSIDYLLYQYLEDRLFNTSNLVNINYNELEKELYEDLISLKKRNKKLVTYLSNKKFTEAEIEDVLNVLCNNKYSELKKRNISKINQIEFYNFCNLFYILDYFTENEQTDFSKLKNFDCVLNFDENKILNYSKTDYQKYFKGIDSSVKSIDTLYKKIETDLQINKARLKAIQ